MWRHAIVRVPLGAGRPGVWVPRSLTLWFGTPSGNFVPNHPRRPLAQPKQAPSLKRQGLARRRPLLPCSGLQPAIFSSDLGLQ
ncbi:hypothetical protein Taro_006150 [Colocasia esculenta]|uniref:Uncharacterized protein n=1 Tax=Colocasia esculenta TaxID=4460 RepID=A0A843TRR0_COLES|nr:hypothetical protein [Colocasia esculenta]